MGRAARFWGVLCFSLLSSWGAAHQNYTEASGVCACFVGQMAKINGYHGEVTVDVPVCAPKTADPSAAKTRARPQQAGEQSFVGPTATDSGEATAESVANGSLDPDQEGPPSVTAVDPDGNVLPEKETHKTRVRNEALQAAVGAFKKLFIKVYGADYSEETSPRAHDSLESELRSVLQIFRAVKGAKIPSQIQLGIQERGATREKLLDKKRKAIVQLRNKLGKSVENLTPATIESMHVFEKLQAGRAKMGGGPRAALSEIADDVRDNFDDLLRTIGRTNVHDYALRKLLVVVANIIETGNLDPSSGILYEAVHDLLVSNFSTADPTVLPATLSTLENYATASWAGSKWYRSSMTPEQKRELAQAVKELRQAQDNLKEPMQEFVKGYTRAKIGFNVISLMTRPNAFAGIPLGHPFHDLLPELSQHPNVLTLGLRAYGDRYKDDRPYKYMDLSIGAMVESPKTANEVYAEEDEHVVSPMLQGRFCNDLRAQWLLRRGSEYALDATIELLQAEVTARKEGIINPVVRSLFRYQIERQTGKTEILGRVAPKDLAKYLIERVETGGQTPYVAQGGGGLEPPKEGPNASTAAGPAKAPAYRQRPFKKLPADLTKYLINSPALLAPWLNRVRPTGENAKNSPWFVFLEPESTEAKPASTVPTVAPLPESEGEAGGKQDKTNVAWHLRSILRDLDARADVLLHRGDQAIQRQRVEKGWINQTDIWRFANDVRELLTVFQVNVAAPFIECFMTQSEEGYSALVAENMLAWYLLNYAPNLAMYVMIGPPGAPGQHAPTTPMLAGIAWRIGFLAVRQAYGDGVADEPVYITAPAVDPHQTVATGRVALASSITTAIAILGLQWGAQHIDDLFRLIPFFRSSEPVATAPAGPGTGEVKPTKPPATPPGRPSGVREEEDNQ